jgi:hypothetical protein
MATKHPYEGQPSKMMYLKLSAIETEVKEVMEACVTLQMSGNKEDLLDALTRVEGFLATQVNGRGDYIKGMDFSIDEFYDSVPGIQDWVMTRKQILSNL